MSNAPTTKKITGITRKGNSQVATITFEDGSEHPMAETTIAALGLRGGDTVEIDAYGVMVKKA